MPVSINKDIAIIGAGLTGLTAAYYLTKYGRDVILIEKDGRTGGVINTETDGDFTFETGPNSGVLSSNEAAGLFSDLNHKCRLETANEKSKKRLIWKGTSWQPLPSGPLSAIGTPLFTFSDKLRILGEPFRKAGENPEESIADLVRRRLGNSFLDYAVDPFISGIYAGDPEKIVTKYAMPKLYNLEHEYGSFIGGSIKKMKSRDKSEQKPSREVFSVDGGLKNLVTALTDATGHDRIQLNCEEINVNHVDGKFITYFRNGNEDYEITSSKVITTAGAYALPSILKFIPSEEIKDISNLQYARVVQVILGFKKWQGIALDAFGGLVPSIEKRKILGVLYSSSLFRNRAPEGGALLSIFMGGIKKPEIYSMNDDEIINIVGSEIKVMMKTGSFEPDLMRIYRYAAAIPQYDTSSGRRLQRINELEAKYPGLILAGNIRDGIGMADRIKQAKTIADNLK